MTNKPFRLFVVVAAVAVMASVACGNSPNSLSPSPVPGPSPPPTTPPGGGCPTGVEVAANIVYRRPANISPDENRITIGYAPFSAGNLILKLSDKVDDYTFTLSVSIAENDKTGLRHRVSASDAGLMPNPTQTATDIYVNDTLVFKAPAPGGVGETGYFRIDGCGKVTAPPN